MIMMVGMALAIFTYRPIFQTFLDDTKYEVPGNISPKNLDIHTSLLSGTQDSLLISTSNYVLPDGKKFQTIQTDTVFYNSGQLSIGKINIINKVLPKATYWKFVGLIFLMILYVTMVYGPIAAFLVEMFPTKIRYTSMSLPYHIGNGVFGGLVPFIGLLLSTTYKADPLVGLWYPIGVAVLCLIIGTLYLRNKIDRNIKD